MIPPHRPDGTLPPGVHQTTIDDLLIAYPPITEQRQILNAAAQRVVEALRNIDPSCRIFIDESYVTSKTEPNDVDILMRTDKYMETEIQRFLEQMCPVEAVSIDCNLSL